VYQPTAPQSQNMNPQVQSLPQTPVPQQIQPVQAIQQQQPPQQLQLQQQQITGFSDLDVDTAPPAYRKEGVDWVSVFNHKAPVLQQDHLNVELLHSLDHESVVCCVKFSACGKFLATGCNRYAQIFDVEGGTKLCTLYDDAGGSDADLYIRSVVFSPDARFLAAGAEDRVIRIWDISQRRVRLRLTGHEQDIYSLDWTRDGKHVVSGSGDKTIRVWDAETAACVLTMTNDDDKLPTSTKDSGVTSVSLNPVYGRCVAAVRLS
jgi:glucose repression regulatory protein TUP1